MSEIKDASKVKEKHATNLIIKITELISQAIDKGLREETLNFKIKIDQQTLEYLESDTFGDVRIIDTLNAILDEKGYTKFEYTKPTKVQPTMVHPSNICGCNMPSQQQYGPSYFTNIQMLQQQPTIYCASDFVTLRFTVK